MSQDQPNEEITEPLKIIIIVRGGVAEVFTPLPKGIEVDILDYDNDPSPQGYEQWTGEE